MPTVCCTGAENTSDDVCCSACARVANGLSMNIWNVNTLYNALLSTGLLTDKVSGDLITNFRDGRQVVRTFIFYSIRT